jgi:hypothetical protein
VNFYPFFKFFLALFWPKLLPALFLKKPWYPCPFEILAETLYLQVAGKWNDWVAYDQTVCMVHLWLYVYFPSASYYLRFFACFRNKDLFLLILPYGVGVGVFGTWSSILTVNLTVNIDQVLWNFSRIKLIIHFGLKFLQKPHVLICNFIKSLLKTKGLHVNSPNYHQTGYKYDRSVANSAPHSYY